MSVHNKKGFCLTFFERYCQNSSIVNVRPRYFTETDTCTYCCKLHAKIIFMCSFIWTVKHICLSHIIHMLERVNFTFMCIHQTTERLIDDIVNMISLLLILGRTISCGQSSKHCKSTYQQSAMYAKRQIQLFWHLITWITGVDISNIHVEYMNNDVAQ